MLNQLGKYDVALVDANKCLELDKTNINALVVRGLIKNGLKKFDESIEDLTKAKLTYSILTLSNKPVESVFGLSYMYFLLALNYDAKGDYNMTLKNVNEAINSDPNDPDYYFFRGRVYSKKEEFSKSITDFTKSIDLGFKNIARVYFCRSIAYFSINNNAKGCEDLGKAEKLGYKDSNLNALKSYCK